MEKKRLIELDIMRGLAIIAVVAIHATSTALQFSSYGTGYLDIIANQYVNQLFRYATPLFLLLSGITLTLSQQSRPLHTVTFYKKRFLRILIPYVLWTIYIGFVFDFEVTLQRVQIIGTHLLKGTAEYHLYFIILVLQCYLLFPFLFRIFSHLPKRRHHYIVAGLLVAHTLALFVFMQQKIRGVYQHNDFAFRFFGLWIFYFILGIVVAFHFEHVTNYVKRFRLRYLAVALFTTAAALIFEVRFLQIPYYDIVNFFRPSVAFYTIMSSIVLLRFSQVLVESPHRLFPSVKHILELLGKHAFGIFLMHIFVIRVFISMTQLKEASVLFAMLLFVISLSASYVLLQLLHALIRLLSATMQKVIITYT